MISVVVLRRTPGKRNIRAFVLADHSIWNTLPQTHLYHLVAPARLQMEAHPVACLFSSHLGCVPHRFKCHHSSSPLSNQTSLLPPGLGVQISPPQRGEPGVKASTGPGMGPGLFEHGVWSRRGRHGLCDHLCWPCKPCSVSRAWLCAWVLPVHVQSLEKGPSLPVATLLLIIFMVPSFTSLTFFIVQEIEIICHCF